MQQWEKLPVFKKAREIMDLVGSIIDSVEKTDIEFNDPIEAEMVQHNLKYLGINASIIPAKIAGPHLKICSMTLEWKMQPLLEKQQEN